MIQPLIAPPTGLFLGHLPAVVRMELSSKDEVELWIVPLFVHRHALKLGSITSNKDSQLVNYVPNLNICKKQYDSTKCNKCFYHQEPVG